MTRKPQPPHIQFIETQIKKMIENHYIYMQHERAQKRAAQKKRNKNYLR